MEQKQIILEKIYELLKKIEVEVEMINDRLDLEGEFTEEENAEFVEGTRLAWEEIDEGKGKKMSVKEFLDEINSFKKNA